METIKAMIAAILEEDGVQPPTSNLSRHRVDDWIRECHLIKAFDKIRPEFTKLEQANLALSDAESQLATLYAAFQLDMGELTQRAEKSKLALEENGILRKQNDNQWSSTRDELNQLVSSSKADVEKYTAELDNVEDEFEQWQEQGIETLSENVSKLAQWQNELEVVTSRYALLTEKHQDVEASYHRRLSDLGEKLTQTLEQLAAARQEAADTRSDQKQQERDSLQRIKDDFSGQITAPV